jgi:hypothetical protein
MIIKFCNDTCVFQIKGITGMHKDDSHMCLLSDSFITKMFALETYDTSNMVFFFFISLCLVLLIDDKLNPDWLHYSDEEYNLLQRYHDGKRASGTRLFFARDDDHTTVKKLVFDDNVNDDEEIRLFVPASDKNIFSAPVL